MADKRITELTNEKLVLGDGDYTIVDSNEGTYKFKLKRILDSIPEPDTTLSIAGRAADAAKTGEEIADVKRDLNYGETQINLIKNGQYQVGKEIPDQAIHQGYIASTGKAPDDLQNQNKTGSSTIIIPISEMANSYTVVDTDFKVTFTGFDSDGLSCSLPTYWITDTNISKQDILDNINSDSAVGFTIRFRLTTEASHTFTEDVSDIITANASVEYIPIGEENLTSNKIVDLMLFMGQSNMAGRGAQNASHQDDRMSVDKNAGWEFRAVTDPTQLYPINESVKPFGYAENYRIDDGTDKTGGLVPAFINAYHSVTGVPVVGISASEGGREIAQFAPYNGVEPKRYKEAYARWQSAEGYLTNNGYTIRHKYVVWCQGETDGDVGTTAETYSSYFNALVSAWVSNGADAVFVIRIGKINVSPYTRYDTLIETQTNLCKTNNNAVMICTAFAGMQARGMMKDGVHYYQDAYNEVGELAGRYAGDYDVTGVEPTMYDPYYNNRYTSGS